MSLDIILEQIELMDNTENDNTFDVFLDINTNEIVMFENDVEEDKKRCFKYVLSDTEENICKNHREEILSYCLATVLPSDNVGLQDIIIHGKYLKRIK